MQLRIFKRQRHVIGNRLQHVFVRARKWPCLFIQQLQHSDRLPAFIANRQAQQRFRAVPQPQIHFGLKSRIGVRIRQIHHLAVLRHPARNPLRDRQPDFVLFESQPHQRPYLFLLAVHQKNRPALRARMPDRQPQNDVQQFCQIERRIQPLRRFHNRRKLDHRASPLAALERHLRVAPEKVQPRARLLIQLALRRDFQHSYRSRPAPQRPRVRPTVRARRLLSVQNSFHMRRHPPPAAFRFPATPPGRRPPSSRAVRPPAAPEQPAKRTISRGKFARLRFRIQLHEDLVERLKPRAPDAPLRAGVFAFFTCSLCIAPPGS